VAKRLDEVIAKFMAEGPTADELERAKTLAVSGTIRGLEAVGGFGGKAVTLAEGALYSNDPEIGVATGASLVGVKVLGDNGSGTFTDIRDGLRWVYDNRVRYNIQVVNMSLGGGFYTSISQVSGDVILPEIRRLESAGITVVSAGGNSFKDHEYQNYGAPGIYSTLVVGATWKDGTASGVRWGSGAVDNTTGAGRITSFSQRMVAPNTIFAPGAFMRSTIPGNRYDNMGGTSQAAPVVAGAVAIMQEAAKQFGGRTLSPTEVREIMT
jgi:subtilisin family serine protease